MDPNVREVLDRLLDVLVRFAQDQLAKRGEFHPFGAFVDADGELSLTHVDEPDALTMIESFWAIARDRVAKGEISAAAIAADVRVATQGMNDAIRVTLEHQQGEPVHCYLPYAKPRFGKIRYGEIVAEPAERQAFVS